jgi:hypothetical protein
MPPDVVGTGMGWWYPGMTGADRGALTFNIDTALSYGPPWDPISGAPEARNSACRITRADPAEVERLGGDFVKESSSEAVSQGS